MKNDKEEPSSSAEQKQAIDLISAVKELHGFSSQELNKLLKDTENFIIQCHTEKGSPIKIDMEKVASFLPLHLIAVLISSDRDEELFRYILRGIRLMYSLCDLAPRHVKLEQILLDDVKVSEQLLDLVFYMLIVLGRCSQEYHNSNTILLMQSTLVACSLCLLTGCLSSQWQDLVQVLLAHPKVDIFMDAAFGAVHVIVMFLQMKLSDQLTDEQVVNYICQQCEASLQFLQSLCQQKNFRERLLRNKELCSQGGVLFLAQSILKLNILPPFVESSTVVASVSRLKAKVLSILLHLCEAESISYLDEVASSPGSLDLAKSVALEVLDLLKTALIKDPKHTSSCSERTYPMGLLQLNAMRLADIFSDDSNFRSYITMCFTEVLSAIFSLSHGDFLLVWCSSEFPVREEDASVEYEPFAATGWVLDTVSSLNKSNATKVEFSLIPNSMPQASYAHQRTSLFVKIIANLHCFVPNICEEQEKNLFLNKFLLCLRMDPSKELPGFSFTSGAQKAATVCRNLRSLLSHAESLIPIFLNDEDLRLLRDFFEQLELLINTAELEEDRVQIQGSKCEESLSCDKFSKLNINENHQSTGGCPSPLQRKEPPNLNNANGNLREEMSENSAFQEEEKFDVGSNLMDQGDDVMRQDSKEDKDKSGVPGGLREKDRDVQIVVSSGSDTSPMGGKNFVDQMDSGEFPKVNEPIKESGFGGVQEVEKVESVQGEEKQQRKRKRTIMNDKQISLIERALLDEPDMQRNTVSIRSWADKLSHYGSEVTASQLKNWLNNRKARLARASKDARAPLGADTSFPGKGVAGHRQIHDSPGSPGEDHLPSNVRGTRSTFRQSPIPESGEFKLGQYVVILDGKGEEIGKGIVNQMYGKWYGKELEESGTCVVDVVELKADKWTRLPYPFEDTGSTFGETEEMLGVIKVLWDCNKMYHLRTR
ncbi:nodulin homeobox isoform X2 [Pistacia vera]|uniref:nodulin homeobox isoform X2 n=1 Tax=Pistacia vera TaxID=55513 RepID=UPI001262D09A|nr:nodulin homeobox isoform X2 [Pistacia vera]